MVRGPQAPSRLALEPKAKFPDAKTNGHLRPPGGPSPCHLTPERLGPHKADDVISPSRGPSLADPAWYCLQVLSGRARRDQHL